MNYASSDTTSRLASGKWRVRHSAWLLAPIFGLGMLSFVGFVYVALRVQSRKFWVACIIACLGSALLWATTGTTESTSDGESSSNGGVILGVWVGLIVYGFVLNRDYLRWRANRTPADAWYNQPSVANAQGQQVSPPKPENPIPRQAAPTREQGVLGVSSAGYYSPPIVPPAPPYQAKYGSSMGLLDANLASRDELASLPGVDMLLAERVVSARERQGSFRNIDDMVEAAALRPHELVRFGGLVTFGESRPDPDVPTTGLPGIRRLDY